jgi:dienelactone hydrolase
MYRHCITVLLVVILLVGCSNPSREETEHYQKTASKDVRITPDVVYGHKFGMALTFDMYQPKKQNGAGIIFINSGGWRSAIPSFYKQTPEGLCLVALEDLEKMVPNGRGRNLEPLLAKGFTVFDVRHGSSPKFEMHEIVADLRRAVRFIRFKADGYGIDAERLGLWGGSAGGHLALLLGTTAEIGNKDATDVFEQNRGKVAAVVAYFPPTDLIRLMRFHQNDPPSPNGQQSHLSLTEDQAKEFSPIYFVSADDPPTLIIHGDQDRVVPIIESESMYGELQKAGVESKLIKIPNADHGFRGDNEAEANDRALAESVSWFEEHLVGK